MEWIDIQSNLLNELISQVGNTQMTYQEYKFISDTVYSINGANFLVFGTGRDSNLWLQSNKLGRTIFLEPDYNWLNIAKNANPNIDIRHIEYNTRPDEALKLFIEYKRTGSFPKVPYVQDDILDIEWDVILIDSPVGAVNGRMSSIYLANKLANKTSKNVHIFLHDSQRDIEILYSSLFLAPGAKLIEEYNHTTNNFTTLNYYLK